MSCLLLKQYHPQVVLVPCKTTTSTLTVLGRQLAGFVSGMTWHQVLVSPCSVRVVPPILALSYEASIIPILNVIHHTLMEFQPSAKLGGINYQLNYGSLSPNGASAQSGRQ